MPELGSERSLRRIARRSGDIGDASAPMVQVLANPHPPPGDVVDRRLPDRGSFRRAATALGARQALVSRRVRDLADALGSAVFMRSIGGATATGREGWRLTRAYS